MMIDDASPVVIAGPGKTQAFAVYIHVYIYVCIYIYMIFWLTPPCGSGIFQLCLITRGYCEYNPNGMSS